MTKSDISSETRGVFSSLVAMVCDNVHVGLTFGNIRGAFRK